MAEGFRYVVKEGECVASVAAKAGLFWRVIWDHSENSTLKRLRGDPNVLKKGDTVFVPCLRKKVETCATEMRHRFRRKGVPSRVRIRIMNNGRPRANEPYLVKIEARSIEGNTNAQGWVEFGVAPHIRTGYMRVGTEPNAEEYDLEFGSLDPFDDLQGIRQRLKNLGFHCSMNGDMDDSTRAALKSFQFRQGLEETGEPDEATKNALRDNHGGT